MPFGSLFGAIVFGILGSFFGVRLMSAPLLPMKLMGACLVLLGLSVAGGLLMSRAWARWMGVLAGAWFAWSAMQAFLNNNGIFQLFIALAALLAAFLLVLPVTGRPKKAIAAPAAAPAVPAGDLPTPAATLNPSEVAAAAPTTLPAPPPARSPWGSALLASSCVAIVGFFAATAWTVASQPLTAAGRAPTRPSGAAVRPGAAPPTATFSTAATWKDFASGIQEAKSARKLVVADFYATWCNPCKYMEAHTFHDPRVVERLRDVVPVRVDAEEDVARGGLKGVDLALRYAIEAYPTIVVVDAEGHELARNTGVMGPDEFIAWLDAVIERAGSGVARS